MSKSIEELLNGLQEELSIYEAKDETVQQLIYEELKDIEQALIKCQKGQYGACEQTGDPLPAHWLKEVPTLKSSKDWNTIWSYGKVSVPFDYSTY
ncbi:hypothetical protein [Heyndrickxia ginsengihumi]|uniref:Uncharacterized protein n=1 Tax=Heyndrickxia ginsengihumi TaxID=363870 RepID=A0A0A6Y1P6_9BACI|nr:hypothetical protein [Heyndrickxia ginsengihumi]KHD86202.1 hypothetical protein NG54_04800 [Heyndrickxia ginsengihumi]MBE6183439.1 hypothetical protein [Bacillus sp. (in: firmicutes)]MCM3022422.1 hypothetical protein [Heyndrickxia ginsengihumi]NEY18635.1 hypothetical protein [Heyndrickxia ginsengihumi]